jgi:hypothetical protein
MHMGGIVPHVAAGSSLGSHHPGVTNPDFPILIPATSVLQGVGEWTMHLHCICRFYPATTQKCYNLNKKIVDGCCSPDWALQQMPLEKMCLAFFHPMQQRHVMCSGVVRV